jgi:hypothetical protein
VPRRLVKCTCGCDFHEERQCPWNGDHEHRLAASEQATGSICQWCKDSGDGRHSHETCTGPKDFKAGLLRNIHKAYDGLKWCWHCSAIDHLTKGCQTSQAELTRTRWIAQIAEIVHLWMDTDFSNYQEWYRDNDEDYSMIPADGYGPPQAAEYKWCIVCEQFDHTVSLNSRHGCNVARYKERCPRQFRSEAITIKRPYVPERIATRRVSLRYNLHNTTTDPFNRYNLRSNTTNLSHRRDSREMSLEKRFMYEAATKLLETVGIDSNGSRDKRSGSWDYLQSVRNPSGKRPSAWLPPRTDFDHRQPIYRDGSRIFGKEIFRDDGAYFNNPTNDQIYFPAATWRITPLDVTNAQDDSLDINRAGRLGLQYRCFTCGEEYITKDWDNDIVMTGTYLPGTKSVVGRKTSNIA